MLDRGKQRSHGNGYPNRHDHTGDTRHTFDPNDAEAVLKAEDRFKDLTSKGFTAAARSASGQPTILRTFDPAAEETLFFPRLVGG
jgi:hypothetical protein